jgi:hypothetical protein
MVIFGENDHFHLFRCYISITLWIYNQKAWLYFLERSRQITNLPTLLWYKLGINILVENLAWVSGPYPAGKWNDIKIFMNELAHCLEPGERVKADNGYVGHADKIKCPNNNCNPEENLLMEARVRSQHETFNARLKFWGILGQVYRHDILKHGSVFYSCAIIAQLAIANNEPLFQVKYGDE